MVRRELIHVGSITQAMKAKEILREKGINAYIERESDRFDKNGCGYGLLIVNGSRAEAILFLRQNNIRLSGGNTGKL